MNKHLTTLTSFAGLLLFLPLSLTAATLYVDLNNLAAAFPYNDWASAATNIQDAVDAAGVGDEVVVTNGVYQTGGRAVYGAMTNRVAITNAITVRSVNGPAATVIQGYQVPDTTNGDSAVRCVYLADGATLIGFTLTNGATGLTNTDPAQRTAEAHTASPPTPTCLIVFWLRMHVAYMGAGAYSGTLRDCGLNDNVNLSRSIGGGGGGAAYSWLSGCTLTGNRGIGGGGAMSCYLTNCTVTGNYRGGLGKCTAEGCAVTGNDGTGVSGGVANGCTIAGNTNFYLGGLGGGASEATLSNCVLYANRGTNGAGAYNCSLSFCTLSNNWAARSGGGVYMSLLPSPVISDCTFCANTAGENGGGLFASSPHLVVLRCTFSGNEATYWGGGLVSIADEAVGSCIFSNNWAGSQGGGLWEGNVTNCSFYNNTSAVGGGSYYADLRQCTLTGNRATNGNGGGAYGGTLTGCILSTNTAAVSGGGSYFATLKQCSVLGNMASKGGGTSAGLVTNCTLSGNSATLEGGGAYGGTLTSCLLTGNQAGDGGGASGGSLNSCTVVQNSAGTTGGGSLNAILNNCIVYYNNARNGTNHYNTWATVRYCCTTPLPNTSIGIGNFTNPPLFVDQADGNFRLDPSSPCINTGYNPYAAGSADLDDNPRIVSGTLDTGAYEYQGTASLISYAWLQRYGWPVDGSADHLDADSDGMDNWQEWICGTDPTNALSSLTMLAPSNSISGVTVRWRGVYRSNLFPGVQPRPEPAGGLCYYPKQYRRAEWHD